MILKRLFDIAAASLGLLLFAPLMLAIALAVKLGSPGPVFFRQQRVGRDFKPFEILKFRSMVEGAPKLGLQLSTTRDPRITGVGRLIRKTKLDELPQLINVLRGDMSLVGPRPEVPKYVELFRSDYEEILRFRPGVTDPASIYYRDENAVLERAGDPEKAYVETVLPEKLALSKAYCRRRSMLYDIYLILLTVFKLLPGQRQKP